MNQGTPGRRKPITGRAETEHSPEQTGDAAERRSRTLQKIPVAELRVGMYIHAFCAKWIDHPFIRAGFVLRSAEDLQELVASGQKALWIDMSKSADPGRAGDAAGAVESSALPTAALPAVPCTPEEGACTARTLRAAARLCRRAMPKVALLFSEARMGNAIDTALCAALVEEIAEFVQEAPNALLAVARLKRHDEYTFMHSVSVCALMTALGRRLGLPDVELRAAGMGGLLHDIGKALVPLQILNKPGQLSEAEMEVMKRHSALGHALMQGSSDLDPIVLDICLRHHEKLDGSGYPGRVGGPCLSLHARMGAVCDVYDAVTSERPYRAGWDPALALRQMAQWPGHIDESVFRVFVATVGIYPVGSLLLLKSGRLAVVTAQHASSLLTPQVKAFYSTKSDMHIEPIEVDLSSKHCHDAVLRCESPADWKFKDLDRLWLDAA